MRVFLAAFLLAAGALLAQASADEQYDACMNNGLTNADYRECGAAFVGRADAGLNAAWRELRALLSEESLPPMLEEQRAWNAYKEKSCLFWNSIDFGTIGSAMNLPACRAGVIEARTAELRAFAEALEEQ